ncbi:beta-galactosidase [Capsulimonas corticalis]|uniref:Beta-galactosidase n=1 Tax=Capsulimonas corticalis TaxID=2219043 RepID=A0A402D6E4_9BACT|nr:sugar-binding domain-containing protein [Capsulimonas corticalis]BDI32045.1 beta-galactosidase [Capsulimonas corticalis]
MDLYSQYRTRQTTALLLVTILSPLTLAAGAQASARFPRAFAPQEGKTTPSERPERDELCLNGRWRFQPVALPAGYHQGNDPAPTLTPPASDGWEKTPIRIPSPWNANSYADQDGLGGDFRCFPSYPASWNSVQMGWLQRKFTVPTAWKGRRLILHFDAVAGDAQVIVNGKQVGEHFDIFLPFDVDVTDTVKPGAQNELLVGVRKASLFDVQGKFGRRPYQGGSMWGQHIAGIWQDVTLEAVPTVHVSNVFVKPLVDQDQLVTDVTVQNDTDHAANITLDRTVSPWISEAGKDVLSAPEPKSRLGAALPLTSAPVRVSIPAHGSQVVTLTGKVGNRLKYWSPTSPNLYGVVCHVKDASGVVRDSKYTRFGWRQITFDNGRTLLNGKLLVMKGDSWHFMGIPQMTRRYAWAWFKTLHDAHLNAVRLHAQPYPAFYLDVADEQGILVLDESAMWASDGGPKLDDPAYWRNTEDHLQGLILRDRNHPGVFGWSVSNEILPVIKYVFHGPQEMQDNLTHYDGIWAGICRKYDPTRLWISADGEDDGGGTLPTYVIHYGDASTMQRAKGSGKPWGNGESSPAYYGTPEQIAQYSGDQRAYLSAEDRMEGVAKVSYDNLIDQRKYDASYRSVFNLVWYALKPLNLGLPDTTRPPALTDGVFFGPYVEGKPGVQPERLGPYSSTLNPGYDPSLPLYEKWPMFDAIQAAQAEPVAAEYKPDRPFTVDAGVAKDPASGTITSVPVLAGSNGALAKALADAGVPVASSGAASGDLLVIDGAQPPSSDAKSAIDKALADGGSVVVWGANPSTLDQLNALLPEKLELTDRTASSLVTNSPSPITAGLTPALLYFSELNPSTVLHTGLGGPLVTKGAVLLSASNTNWNHWNQQAETSKTIMLLRSERETKPSGAALVDIPSGSGHLILCSLPAAAETSKAAALNRTIWANLGVKLGDGAAQRNVLNANGELTRALAWGWKEAGSTDDALKDSPVDSNAGKSIVFGSRMNDRNWKSVGASGGALDLGALEGANSHKSAIGYLSFWLYSPKDLANLLLDPHLPNVTLTVGSVAGAQIWLNGKSLPTKPQGDGAIVNPLLLPQGWSHLLVKIVRSETGLGAQPSLSLQSSQADYLPQIHGAQEKP